MSVWPNFSVSSPQIKITVIDLQVEEVFLEGKGKQVSLIENNVQFITWQVLWIRVFYKVEPVHLMIFEISIHSDLEHLRLRVNRISILIVTQ